MAPSADVDDEANEAERYDRRRTTMAEKRKWDSCDRHDAHGHAHVLEYLKGQHG